MLTRYLVFIGLILSCCLGVRAQRSLVFAGTFNRDKNKDGILVLELDTSTGLLKPLSAIKGILNPSYLSLSEKGEFLYACTETQTPGAGSILAFKVDPAAGSLTMLSRRKTSGENPVYITLSKNSRYLFSVNYTEGGVDVFPLATDGSMGTAIQTIAYDKGSAVTPRQTKAHPHSVLLAPGEDYIFIPDLGSDLIRSYKLDPDAPKPISEHTSVVCKAPPGSGPRHLTFHPGGKYAYCIEEISGTITAYTYTAGRLVPLQHIAAHKDSLGAYNSADIHLSPDGRFLYASNRGDENNIAVFTVQENGRLRNIGYQPALGVHPRIFALSAGGGFLVVANQISGNVVVFRRDKTSGLLQPVPQEINIENVSCVRIQHYDQ